MGPQRNQHAFQPPVAGAPLSGLSCSPVYPLLADGTSPGNTSEEEPGPKQEGTWRVPPGLFIRNVLIVLCTVLLNVYIV